MGIFRHFFTACVVALITILGSGSRSHAQVLFTEQFNGGVGAGWSIVRSNASYYSYSPTSLTLRANSRTILQSNNTANNLFLISTPTAGNFQIDVRVELFSPSAAVYPQFHLLAYDDDNNYMKMGCGRYSAGDAGLRLEVNREVGAVLGGSSDGGGDGGGFDQKNFGSAPFWLRMVKMGNFYSEYWSTNGVDYFRNGRPLNYGDGTPTKWGGPRSSARVA